MLPSGKSGKSFIDKTTRLLNAWVDDSPLKTTTFKGVMVMPSLLLQKPLKISTITTTITTTTTTTTHTENNTHRKQSDRYQRNYPEHMRKGNIHNAMKLLTSNLEKWHSTSRQRNARISPSKTSNSFASKRYNALIDGIKTPHLYTRTWTQKLLLQNKRRFWSFWNGRGWMEKNHPQ